MEKNKRNHPMTRRSQTKPLKTCLVSKRIKKRKSRKVKKVTFKLPASAPVANNDLEQSLRFTPDHLRQGPSYEREEDEESYDESSPQLFDAERPGPSHEGRWESRSGRYSPESWTSSELSDSSYPDNSGSVHSSYRSERYQSTEMSFSFNAMPHSGNRLGPTMFHGLNPFSATEDIYQMFCPTVVSRPLASNMILGPRSVEEMIRLPSVLHSRITQGPVGMFPESTNSAQLTGSMNTGVVPRGMMPTHIFRTVFVPIPPSPTIPSHARIPQRRYDQASSSSSQIRGPGSEDQC